MILSIEGIKGSGKTTVIEMLREGKWVDVAGKYSKFNFPYYSELAEFKKKYGSVFNNIDDALGMKFNSNFIHNLGQINKEHAILDKGMVSLPLEGYYGYVLREEGLEMKNYEQINGELYQIALEKYRPLAEKTAFIILECNEDERRKRLLERGLEKPSDRFFFNHMKEYQRRFDLYLAQAKASLPEAKFLHFKNENPEDLEKIIAEAQLLI